MSWLDLPQGIWELFAEAHHLVERTTFAELDQWNQMLSIRQPMASIKRAYQLRQVAAGRCRSCPAPLSPESRTKCAKHLESSRRSARESYHRKRISLHRLRPTTRVES